MNFKIYIQLFNIISTFCFKQPIPFADSSLSKQGIHKIAIPGNEDVAVWWSMKDQKWNAVHDMCPHAQASLSKGVVTSSDFCIKCSYHGIEFNGNGNCTLIPSSNYDKNIFSVKKYYIKEKYNLLWIDDTNDNQPPFIEVLEHQHCKFLWGVYISNSTKNLIFENSFDQTHADHLHNGMFNNLFNRKKGMIPQDCIIEKSKINWFNETGFSCLVSTKNTEGSEVVFIKPFLSYSKVIYPNIVLINLVYPISKNKTVLIGNFIKLTSSSIEHKILTFIFNLFEPYVKKQSKEAYRQDIDIVNSQNENIEKYGIKYIMSGELDRPIVLYQEWLKKYGDQEQS